MKIKSLTLGILGSLCLAAASAEAVPYCDTDLFATILNKGTSLEDTFNIAGGDGDVWDVHGYNGTQTIVSALAKFTFLDLNWWTETTVEIDLGSTTFDEVTSMILPVLVGGDVVGDALFDLRADGVLGYTITNTGRSSFMVLSACLEANATPRAVPDGGATLGLLGLGLVATAIVARRSSAKKCIA